jgi:cell division transport system permease protein
VRSVREALTASRRAPLLSALGIVTIAFSLFAFGLFGLVAINIRRALDQVEERVEVRAFLGDSVEIESVMAAMKDIGEFPEVLRFDYVN